MVGRKISLTLLIFTFCYFIYPVTVNAESLWKDYPISCLSGEEKVICQKESGFNFVLFNNCSHSYDLNPNYSYKGIQKIEGTVSRVYCLKKLPDAKLIPALFTRISDFISGDLSIYVFLTLMTELPIFFALGFRTKKKLARVLLVNFISIPLIRVTIVTLPVSGLLIWVPLLIFTILFEAGVIVAFSKRIGIYNTLYASALANLASFIVANLLVSIL